MPSRADHRAESAVTVADGLAFTEGPRWHRGALWFSDFFTLGVYRVAPGGRPERVCTVPGGPSGLGFDPQGRLLISSMGDRRVLRLQGGELTELADLAEIAPASLNDMVASADGGVYVGNFGLDAELGGVLPSTRLIRVDPGGEARFVGGELFAPNGAVITDQGGTLLVAETLGGRIVAYTIAANGDLTDERVWAQLGPEPEVKGLFEAMEAGPVPDGIALDCEGALWVGNACGPALRVAPGGEVLDRLEVPGNCVYALAFGGEDLRTMFMCVAPSLREYWPVPTDPDVPPPPQERQARVIACQVEVPGVRSNNESSFDL